MKKVLILTRYSRLGASSRLRSYQYLDYFKREHQGNIEFFVHSLFLDDYLLFLYQNRKVSYFATIKSYIRRFCFLLFNLKKFDVVWIEKEMFPYVPGYIERWLLRRKIVMLDYDDAIFHNYDRHSSKFIRKILGKKFSSLVSKAQIVCCGNQYLAAQAVKAGSKQIKIIPTAINLDKYSSASVENNNSVSVIGWIGSPATQHYLYLLVEVLQKLAQKYRYKLYLIGVSANFNMPGVPFEILQWAEEKEVMLINQIDVGIMPLYNSEWEHGKCGYKLIQYMGCRKPVIASPVGINCEIIQHGENGYLASSHDEWYFYLEKLLNDKELSRKLGNKGYQCVEEKYSIQVTGPKLFKLLNDLVLCDI